MKRTVVARGKLCDARHIELAQPIEELQGEVEVTVREIPPSMAEDVFEVIASLAAGTRSKADIDRQIYEERASWNER
jgi:actin-like ATPase involved in cell morphogenesis